MEGDRERKEEKKIDSDGEREKQLKEGERKREGERDGGRKSDGKTERGEQSCLGNHLHAHEKKERGKWAKGGMKGELFL